MFGSTSQKPGGFSFGGNANSATNTSTPSFSFGTTNNNAISNTNTAFNNTKSNPDKPSGFSFGGNTSAQSKPTGFAFSNNTTNSGLSLGNGTASQNSFFNNTSSNGTQSNSQSSVTASKPQLFGNSVTNPLFANTTSTLGFGQNTQDLSKIQMPKPLTSATFVDDKKRRRSSSTGSFTKDDKKVPSVSVNVDKVKTPSKFSLESMRGLFSSKNKTNEKTNTDAEKYSLSLAFDIDHNPSRQSEYRKLIIRNPKDRFSNFHEIDANRVLLSKIEDSSFFIRGNKNEIKQEITNLKPVSKRSRCDYKGDNEELTFSKPISEQFHDEATTAVTDTSYWCSPPIEELSKLTSLELTRVDNFIAGRKGYGHLMFKFPVDLSEFEGKWDTLLGNTIIFDKRTLEVYPVEFTKPSEGNGLNVPAVITLEKVFPSKYDPLNSNPQILEEHIHKLKTAHGMKFISFDPITGNYVFEVQHFSIWGIVDEEDDDPKLVERWKKQQEKEFLNEKRRTEIQIGTLEKITGYGQPGDNWKKQKSALTFEAPGGFQLEDKHHQTERMQEDKFEAADDFQFSSGVQTENEPEDDANKKLLLLSTKLSNIDELVETRAYEPEVKDVDMDFINAKTELSVADNWDEQLRLSNGFFSVFNENLNQRYKMPLDPQSVGNLIFDDKDISTLPKAIVQPPLKFENSIAFQNCLKTEALEANCAERSNGFSLISFERDIDLSVPLTGFEETDNFDVWELMAIMYDERFLCTFLSRDTLKVCEDNMQKLNYVLDLKRKELLCSFLQRIISIDNEQTSIDFNASKEHTADRIYHFICMDNIADATQYAINTKNNHLAVLLTMLGSDDSSVREIARSQLKEWSNGTSVFVPSGVMKVYKLLSGDILSKEYIDHLEGLSWPVIMFLMIKFGDSSVTLHQIINDMINYAEIKGISENAIYKFYFSLFKLIGKKSNILPSFNIELQFLLMKKLKPVLTFNDEQFNEVTRKFAGKLQRAGMLEESLFVLEHLTDDDESKRLVTELLHQNVSQLGFLADNARLNQIHQLYRVPKSLLYESRSVEFIKRKEYEKSVCELILAGKLGPAQELFLQYVAPEKIISGKKSNINNLKSLIKEFTILSDYKISAGVYNEYIEFVELSEGLNSNDSEYSKKVENLQEGFADLITNVSRLKEFNSNVRIAKTLMQKQLIKILFKYNLHYDPNFLLRLELPESEKNYLEAKIIKTSDDRMLIS